MNDLLTPDKIWSDFSQYLRPDRFGVIGAKDVEAIKAMTFKREAAEDSKGPGASAP